MDLRESLGILAFAESERDKLLLVEDEARGRERVRPSVRPSVLSAPSAASD